MIELAGIIILGILAQWFAWKLKIPAILPLILIGLLVGPISAEFLSEDGTKWIEPQWNGTEGLFPGESCRACRFEKVTGVIGWCRFHGIFQKFLFQFSGRKHQLRIDESC